MLSWSYNREQIRKFSAYRRVMKGPIMVMPALKERNN